MSTSPAQAAIRQNARKKAEDRLKQTVIPPEAVPLEFTRATLSTRFGAQLLDIALTFGGLYLVLLFFVLVFRLDWSSLTVLALLGSFFVRMPYYFLSEIIWNGQTLGKKATGITVISADGRSLSPYQVVVRNLMKEAEVFFPIGLVFGFGGASGLGQVLSLIWICVIALVPILSKRNQRLGDMIAGTYVVEKPKLTLFEDLSLATSKSGYSFVFEPKQLEVYGRYELQTLEEMLRINRPDMYTAERVRKVTATIHKKINYPQKIPQGKERQFLLDFYAQQRQYLESRQIFGDVREDKFYNKS